MQGHTKHQPFWSFPSASFLNTIERSWGGRNVRTPRIPSELVRASMFTSYHTLRTCIGLTIGQHIARPADPSSFSSTWRSLECCVGPCGRHSRDRTGRTRTKRRTRSRTGQWPVITEKMKNGASTMMNYNGRGLWFWPLTRWLKQGNTKLFLPSVGYCEHFNKQQTLQHMCLSLQKQWSSVNLPRLLQNCTEIALGRAHCALLQNRLTSYAWNTSCIGSIGNRSRNIETIFNPCFNQGSLVYYLSILNWEWL